MFIDTFETRHFRLIGTGHEFELSTLFYIGTAKLFNDDFVWHLFEQIK